MGARSSLCVPPFDMPFPLPSAGGRWPPLRGGPICAARFPVHRRGRPMGARSVPCVSPFEMPFPLPSAGGRWPPLRLSPICAARFPVHRRGAQWAPVLPYAFRRLIAVPSVFGGRPMAAPTPGLSMPFAFRNRRRGAQWGPLRGEKPCQREAIRKINNPQGRVRFGTCRCGLILIRGFCPAFLHGCFR